MSIILLVEDNIMQAESLKKHLTGVTDDCTVLHVTNSKAAFEYAVKYDIDLFILDIGLPDKMGLKLAEEIRSIPRYKYVWIIFVTGFKDYLPEAVSKTHCYDYIVKPYNPDKVKELIRDLLNDKNNLHGNNPVPKFTVICKDFTYQIRTDKILYIEVYQKVCLIHTYFDIAKIKRFSLKKAYEQLPSTNFIQCHKSIIVNTDYINYIKKTESNWQIILLNYPNTLPVGEKYRENLIKAVPNKIIQRDDKDEN